MNCAYITCIYDWTFPLKFVFVVEEINAAQGTENEKSLR